MSYLWTGGMPRNTSNGDYGRFLFTSNGTNTQGNLAVSPSADGNRMVHHAHYPNCPNRNSQSGQEQPGMTGGGEGSKGMADYTIEYGEDAVRAALGGSMPDFQAQFMQQMGGGNQGNGVRVDPQNIQMMNNGKGRVAMIPVVFGDHDDDQQPGGSSEGNNNDSIAHESNISQPQSQSDGNTVAETSPQVQAVKPKPPKQENIMNAYNAVSHFKPISCHVKCND